MQNDVPAKRRITLENILTMTTGMDYPLLGEPRLAPMREAADMVQAIIDFPMVAEPGTVFGYNSGGSHLLSALLTRSTGWTAEDFAREHFFDPLGIRAWSWPSDRQATRAVGGGIDPLAGWCRGFGRVRVSVVATEGPAPVRGPGPGRPEDNRHSAIETPVPTGDELRILRDVVDPERVFLR